MDGLVVLKFVVTIGAEPETFVQEFPEQVLFFRCIKEIVRKLSLLAEDIVISVPGGSALTNSEYNLTVDEISKRYGDTFTIINRGIVGVS